MFFETRNHYHVNVAVPRCQNNQPFSSQHDDPLTSASGEHGDPLTSASGQHGDPITSASDLHCLATSGEWRLNMASETHGQLYREQQTIRLQSLSMNKVTILFLTQSHDSQYDWKISKSWIGMQRMAEMNVDVEKTWVGQKRENEMKRKTDYRIFVCLFFFTAWAHKWHYFLRLILSVFYNC